MAYCFDKGPMFNEVGQSSFEVLFLIIIIMCISYVIKHLRFDRSMTNGRNWYFLNVCA